MVPERRVEGTRGGTFIDLLAEIAETLASGTTLIGDETSKESDVWRTCKRVLLAAGWPVRDNVSGTEFWKAARVGQTGSLKR